jgi:hypothetical protein
LTSRLGNFFSFWLKPWIDQYTFYI